MPIQQTDWAIGRRATLTSERAGAAVTQELRFILKAGKALAPNTKIEMGALPAYHDLMGGTLFMDAMGNGVTANVGYMTGEVGRNDDTRAVGSELMAGVNAAAASVTQLTSATALGARSLDTDRAVGVVIAAGVAATGSDRSIQLTLIYAPPSN